MTRLLETKCCIAGGGPAGLVLGFLLARAGIDTVILEKHADFLRDFRGDTIHPSTMEVMHELGLLEEFLRLPHQRVPDLSVEIGGKRLRIADFSHLPVHAPFIAMMPQWDFLNFLARQGRQYPGFRLLMEAEAQNVIRNGETITGIDAIHNGEPLFVHAPLSIAADGRWSAVRDAAGLVPENLGAPMDALWFRLPRKAGDTQDTQGRIAAGRILIMLNRGDYWQCAFVIPKGGDERLRAAGLEAFRREVGRIIPFEPERAESIADLSDVKLLVVQINRLEHWWAPGLLCIGDAAHAMSPVGGVGVNLAVQDAVAAANILAAPLAKATVRPDDLQAVQERRAWPTRATQRFQIIAQNRLIRPALEQKEQFRPPLLIRMLARIPGFNRLPARLVGLGFRPEHLSGELRRPGTYAASEQ